MIVYRLYYTLVVLSLCIEILVARGLRYSCVKLGDLYIEPELGVFVESLVVHSYRRECIISGAHIEVRLHPYAVYDALFVILQPLLSARNHVTERYDEI